MGESTVPTSKPDTQLFHDVFNASPIGIAVENLDGQPVVNILIQQLARHVSPPSRTW